MMMMVLCRRVEICETRRRWWCGGERGWFLEEENAAWYPEEGGFVG